METESENKISKTGSVSAGKDEGKPVTNTEYLACFVGRKLELRDIRNMAYEAGKRMAKFNSVFGCRAVSQWAGDWVVKFEREMDDIFL